MIVRPDHKVVHMVNRVMNRLIEVGPPELRQLSWEVIVLNANVDNAMVLPGTYLLKRLKVERKRERKNKMHHLDEYTDSECCVCDFVGGKVCVFAGIFPLAHDEEGLACVLAHEIGHVIARK